MNVGELKKVLSNLDDDVFVEIIVEYGFEEKKVLGIMNVGYYYDDMDKVLVFEGNENENDEVVE